jgi:hypothetical protein
MVVQTISRKSMLPAESQCNSQFPTNHLQLQLAHAVVDELEVLVGTHLHSVISVPITSNWDECCYWSI